MQEIISSVSEPDKVFECSEVGHNEREETGVGRNKNQCLLQSPEVLNRSCLQSTLFDSQAGKKFNEYDKEAPLDLSLSKKKKQTSASFWPHSIPPARRDNELVFSENFSSEISFDLFISIFSNTLSKLFLAEFPLGVRPSDQQSYSAFMSAALAVYPYAFRSWILLGLGYLSSKNTSPVDWSSHCGVSLPTTNSQTNRINPIERSTKGQLKLLRFYIDFFFDILYKL